MRLDSESLLRYVLPDPELEAVILSERKDRNSLSGAAEASVGLYSVAGSREVESLGSGGRLGRREETEDTMLDALSSTSDSGLEAEGER